MHTIRVNKVTGVPVFRQIEEQIVYMVEMGQLEDGDRLPSSRMLADNLHVNRNTVVRAYAELQKRGLVSRQGRHGMVVRGLARCLELGLSAEEIASLAYQHSLNAERSEVRLAFVECNLERAESFAHDLGSALDVTIAPLVLGDIEAAQVRGTDLVITTFFHLAEVRRLVRELVPDEAPEVLGIVVAPHLKTLVRLAEIPAGHKIGVYYTTDHQAEAIRVSLTDAGVHDIEVITGREDPAIAGCDLVIVPSENPELGEELQGLVPLLEFGNVLDAGSIQIVGDVLDDVRERKTAALGARPSLPAVA